MRKIHITLLISQLKITECANDMNSDKESQKDLFAYKVCLYITPQENWIGHKSWIHKYILSMVSSGVLSLLGSWQGTRSRKALAFPS